MPQIAFDPFGGLVSMARHTPIPTLNSYIVLSIAVAVCSTFYAKHAGDQHEMAVYLRGDNDSFGQLELASTDIYSSIFSKYFYYLLLHPTVGWIFVNAACAVLAMLAKFAVHITVGKLSAQESMLLRDRLCNFLLYKAVFLFGVLNTVMNDELVAWVLWFAVLAAVTSTQSIISYKLKYLVSTIPSRIMLTRIMILCVVFLIISAGFVSFAFTAFSIFSLNIALFIMADVIKTFVRSVYMIIKCALLFEDLNKQLSSLNVISLTYYLEFINDIIIDVVDLFHHTHMLIYSQVMLSMACIVISIQLRSFYKSFISRIDRHRKYKRICSYINSHYPEASQDEIIEFDEWCAICWEPLENARKLPCNHLFHEWCLRRWLQQDSSCPTCRVALPSSNNGLETERRAPTPLVQPFNHVFRFNGTRYARWLPSFSVELSHNVGPSFFQHNRPNLDHSQLNSLALQIHEMFPQLELAAITEDLRESGSLQATTENILEGRFRRQDPTFELDEENWSGTNTPTSSGSSSESLSLEPADLVSNQMDQLLSIAAADRNPADTLAQKKSALVEHNRRQYVASSRGSDLRSLQRGDVTEQQMRPRNVR